MSTIPIPDTLTDAIDRAARSVKRRADIAHSRDPEDRLTLRDDVEDYHEDIEAELSAPISEIAARLDALETAMRNATIMWGAGMTVEAHRLVEDTLAALDE